MSSLEEHEEDLSELREFVDQAKRPKVKEILNQVIEKLEGRRQVEGDVDDDPVDDVVDAVIGNNAEISKPGMPAFKKATTTSPLVLNKPKFQARITLKTGQSVDVIVDERHRETLISHSSTICTALAKYVEDSGVPKEPFYLDLNTSLKSPGDVVVNPAPERKCYVGENVFTSHAKMEKVRSMKAFFWTDKQVETLLEGYKRHQLVMKKAFHKEPVWDTIGEELTDLLGVEVSGRQCLNKFKNLKRRFYKAKNQGTEMKWMKELAELHDENFDADLASGQDGEEDGETRMAIDTSLGDVPDIVDNKINTSINKPSTPPRAARKRPRTSTARRAEEQRLETLRNVQTILTQSDQRLNETLLKLHSDNKQVMEKLINKL